jgi:hypothetical protein
MPFSPRNLRPDPKPETMAELRDLLPPSVAAAAVEAAVAEYVQERRTGEVRPARREANQRVGSGARNMARSRSAGSSVLDRSQSDDE